VKTSFYFWLWAVLYNLEEISEIERIVPRKKVKTRKPNLYWCNNDVQLSVNRPMLIQMQNGCIRFQCVHSLSAKVTLFLVANVSKRKNFYNMWNNGKCRYFLKFAGNKYFEFRRAWAKQMMYFLSRFFFLFGLAIFIFNLFDCNQYPFDVDINST
jgi:hypothetical protein